MPLPHSLSAPRALRQIIPFARGGTAKHEILFAYDLAGGSDFRQMRMREAVADDRSPDWYYKGQQGMRGRVKMSYLRIASVGAAWWAATTFAAPAAMAESVWVDGRPVFRSDVLREQEQLQRQRESRRKVYDVISYPPYAQGGPRPDIVPEVPPIVPLAKAEKPGVIIIDTGGRRLYYVLPGNQAYEYPISVGREGFAWTGTEKISRIAVWPEWNPPAEMRERQRGLPINMTGGVNNPLGAKALYLGNTLYRIHGTNEPRSIGRASSSGCFRMMNQHVTHLATLAGVGTTVRVVSQYGGTQSAAR